MFYELSASTWGNEEIEAIEKVLRGGRLTMGPEVAAFEREFADYFGMRHGIMVNSGSSADLVSTAALFFKRERPLQRGDEAIVPAISWSTMFHPLQQYGLKLRFVDVERDTLNVDVSKLEAALTPKSRLLVAVSILGNPAALDTMRDFAKRHGLYMLEDNCESADAELAGRKTGTFGHLNTFSFFFSHHISTMEGGMVLTDDDELMNLVRSIRAHGWTRDLPPDSPLFERRGNEHFEAYRFILPGYNVRPLEISAAAGREQLKKLPDMTRRRRENWKVFKELFGGDKRFITQRENGKTSCFSFTIILNPEFHMDRERVFSAMRDAGIGFRMITGGCFPSHEAIRYFDFDVVGDLRNAELAHTQGFFVGNHPFDLKPQLTKLREVLDRVCTI
ncbi:MAG TPA: DegT/DnrJ/EryC1/StrS family aminotransferase [Terriglobia bacterium]|nr:DegT/DnrJ/EryC1/StrS family aminotransferase [Terriglobia bacterium]